MPSEGSPIDDSDVRGLKHLRRLLPLFARLHEVGCQRDSAANRTLHFDEYCTLVMLYLFNPLIDSVRGLQHASGLPSAKKLGLGRFSLGSFSEAPGVFEPNDLKEIIAELAADAKPLAQHPRLADLKHALTLADGTVLEALPRLTRAIGADSRPHGGVTDKAYKGQRVCDRLVIVTSLVDLPADLTALIYKQRYTVELFFRFFKHLLGMRHLLSRRPGGVDIQVYCAVIACLLINLQTGRKPDKRMMETIGWYLMGLMDEQQALDELSKPDNRGMKLRAKAEVWKKLGL